MSATSKETCLADLKRRILAMDLAPGADLDETRLAERYGLSRTPLREVLQRLAGDAYVQLAPNRGAKVASLDLGTLRVFFQTAPMVYANMARLAAENRTGAQLDQLKDSQRQFRRATEAGDADGAVLANHRFHALIGEMAGNPYLMAALDRLLIDHTRMSQVFYRPETEEDSALVATARDQHDAMIAALEAREAALVTELTLEHWDLSRRQIERFARPDPLPVDVISLKDRKHAL